MSSSSAARAWRHSSLARSCAAPRGAPSPRQPPSTAASSAPASHPFLDLLDAAFNAPSAADLKAALEPRRALTENYSATCSGSGNPCLDFFFQVVPSTPAARVRDHLALAWAHDPLTALKLAYNLRGVRGTGKSDREGFYAAAVWMHAQHPRTLACNVTALADFDYLKDFPELLFRLIHGPDVRKVASENAAADKTRRKDKDFGKKREADRQRLLRPPGGAPHLDQRHAPPQPRQGRGGSVGGGAVPAAGHGAPRSGAHAQGEFRRQDGVRHDPELQGPAI